MRIGVLSDTHNQVERADEAVHLLVGAGAEALIHCGDLTGPAVVRACAAGPPTYYVFGNNDYDQAALLKAMAAVGATCLGRGGEVVLGGRRLAVTHGDSTREVKRLAALAPDYLFYGHSHVPADEQDGPTRWVNPGALHRAERWTVAVVDLDDGALEWLTVGGVSP